jgi:pimeloyl-ACP methyl ester carboxylesterase
MRGYRLAAALTTIAIGASACGAGATPSAPAPDGSFFTSGDVRLAYTLDVPGGTGPFPAIVAGHGSGRITRQQMEWLSRRWTALGFAVLRFDKRGVGESTGTYRNFGAEGSPTMIPLLAGDIAAGVRFLRRRREIDPRRVGLAGNSQAGWILPHAARELGDVPFMVLLAGPVCTVGEEGYYSQFAEGTARPLEEVYALMPSFSGFHGYDPLPALRAIDTPTLWLLGDEDRSIPIRTTVANLASLAAAGKPFEWHTYPGLDHSLGPGIWADIERWVQRFKP